MIDSEHFSKPLAALLLGILLVVCSTAAVQAEEDYRTIVRNQPASEDTREPVWRALVIGIGEYRSDQIKDLRTPVADARAVARVLRENYDFSVTTLLDQQATWRRIDDELRKLVREAGPDDSVLIYYGGHGDLDLKTGEGWWYPHDAEPGNHQTYLKNGDLRQKMKQFKARHALLVSDSCFAGSLFGEYRSASFLGSDAYHQRLYDSRSRLGLTSGGKEPVLDKGGGDHSIFAHHFLKYLENPEQPVFSVGELYRQIAPVITNNSPQKPEFLPILYTGHERGEFIFVSRGENLADYSSPIVSLTEPGEKAFTWILQAVMVAVLTGAAMGLFFLVRPRLQRRLVATRLQQACEQRDLDKMRALFDQFVDDGTELARQVGSLMQPVTGIELLGLRRAIRIAPGPRQGVGRGERWVFSILDPHVSRAPHGWLHFSERQLVLTADGGKILQCDQETRVVTLEIGEPVLLGRKTELTLRRFVPERLAVLEVTGGPENGALLVMASGAAMLADLLSRPELHGAIVWRDERPYLEVPAGSQSPLPHLNLESPVLLADDDLLRLGDQDWQVRLK